MKKKDIMAMIQKIFDAGLFTNSKTNRKVFERYKRNANEDIGFIITNKNPKKKMECRECHKNLSIDKFSFYQTRVASDGYLMRSNALCNDCGGELNKSRTGVLKKDKDKIPEKPKSGDICSRCNRAWHGNWHRDHNDITMNFKGWICGNCNMSKQDQRNKDVWELRDRE